MYKLPTLYKITKTKAIQQWSVEAQDGVITVTQGQVGGAMQQYPTHCEPKNVARANETTAKQQAESEAKSKWEKQIKAGYVEDESGESQIKLPMKVKEYQKQKKNIIFPCDISPKYNGVNGECRISEVEDTFVQLSRGGENYPLPDEMAQNQLNLLMGKLGVDSLNYEVYYHGAWLQDIQSAVKKPSGAMGKNLHHKLQYMVFDSPTMGGTWEERKWKLKDVFRKDNPLVNTVPWFEVNSHEEIEEYHKYYTDQGFEGIIIRNNKGTYEYNQRSSDVFKYKVPASEEFLIKSYFVDKLNQPVFWCLAEGGEFKAKPVGTKEQRAAILKEADNWVGKYMTVEFEMYSKDIKPQKPIGIGLREGYVKDGEFIPTE